VVSAIKQTGADFPDMYWYVKNHFEGHEFCALGVIYSNHGVLGSIPKKKVYWDLWSTLFPNLWWLARWTISFPNSWKCFFATLLSYLLVIPIPRMKELIAADDTPLLRRPASVNSRGSSHPSTHLSVTGRFSCKTGDAKSNYVILWTT
jgi:hypothetical protein